MRNVLQKSEVAHFWANKRQNSGRNAGSNFYFEGDTIYSYGSHFPIASHSKELGTVLMTTRSYSNTTAKHINEVRHAISHKTIIYCHNPKNAIQGLHSENINSFESEAKFSAGKLEKAKKPDIYLNEIAHQKALLTKYVEFFGLNPKAYKHLHYINIVTKDGAIVVNEKEQKAQEIQRKQFEKLKKERHILQIKTDTENLGKWRKRSSDYNHKHTLHIYALTGTYLRFNTATQEIETSKGVQIPVKVAERFYKWLKHQLTKGGCNGECEHTILGYSVDYVNTDGIKVGCHDVNWTEIDAMAKKMKWTFK